MIDNPRENLVLAGASAEDIAWFDAFGWRDDAVPPAEAQTLADYRRREAMLNKSIETLTLAERANARAGRLAAALGARIADALDAEDEEEG